ncbi:MAG: Hpt domain-containing protein [Gammaproteobacteria bacterium]|nr:Hpt domain-containing protein [Gammaproteobacteria bacterium]
MSDSRSFMALDWVRDEIDTTLKQAQEALEAYVEAGRDATQARQCLSRLHQVHGTLQMVELPGAVAFAAELEAVAQALMDGTLADQAGAQEALMEGILQLAAHLDRVQRGAADELRPYRPLLNRLRVARGEAPEELVARGVDAEAMAAFIAANGPDKVRQLRASYQKAMLALLRRSQPAEKLWAFFDRLFTQLEAVTPTSPLSRLWALAAAGMERQDASSDTAALLPLLRRLDAEIRRLAETPEQSLQSPAPAELSEALRERLEPATDRDSARVIALRSQWSDAVASGAEDFSAGADDATIATVAAALHEELAGIRDQLDLFARGSVKDTAELTGLADVLQRVAGTLAVVGLDELEERINSQLEAVATLVREGSASDDAVMDVASAVLEVDGRLMALAGISSEDGDLIPGSLSEAHTAVIREVRSSLEGVKQSIVDFVSSEWEHAHLSPIAGTLAAVRSVLGLIPLERASNLVECCRLYLQNEILADQRVPEWQRLDTLADALTSIDYYLERMLSDRSIPDPKLLDIADESVTELGYPLSALATAAPLLPVMRVDDDETTGADEGVASVDPEPEPFPPSTSFETDLADEGASQPEVAGAEVALTDEVDFEPASADEATEEVVDDALLGAPADDAPSQLTAPTEADFDLESDQDFDAPPAMDADEPLQTELPPRSGPSEEVASNLAAAVDEAFDSGVDEGFEAPPFDEESPPAPRGAPADDSPSEFSAPTEDAFDLGPAPDDGATTSRQQDEATSSPGETAVVAFEDDDEDDPLIDDEIIEIFLEEVDEVLEHLDQRLPALRSDPMDRDALGDVRRAFHTLKGSGRMVGAAVIGELAWSVENMLNRVIDGTIAASQPVLDLVHRARAAVPALRQAFAERRDQDTDVQRLMENADILASGGSEEDLQYEDDEANELQLDSKPVMESDFILDEDFEGPETGADEGSEAEPELLEVFDQEAGEHLATLHAYLAEHRQTGICPPLVDGVRRALHTLKGSAAMAELPGLSEVAARMEHLVRGYLEIQRSADDALLNVLQRGVERMEALRSYLLQMGTEPVFSDADAAFVDAADALSDELMAEISARESGAAPGGTVAEVFRSDAMDRIVDGAAVIDTWAAGVIDTQSRVALCGELSELSQRARAVGEGAIAALAAALGHAIGKRGTPAYDAQQAVHHGHEQLLAQLDALAAGLEVPDARAAVADIEAFTGAAGQADASLVDDPSTLDLDPEMLDIFFEEADELLQDVETGLAAWPSAAAREGLMRALHTLKGGARMAGLDGLGSRVHELESWLGEADDDDASVRGRLQDELDELIGRIARLRRGEAVGSGSASSVQSTEPLAPEGGQDWATAATEDLPSSTSAPVESDFDLEGLATEELLPPAPPPQPEMDEPAASVPEWDAAEEPTQQEAPAIAPYAAEAGVAEADPEILALFQEEAQELTESLDATLGDWQREPDNELHLESLLRDLHTLKGGARMAGLSALGDTAHDLETTLTTVRGQTPAADFLAQMQEAVDALVVRVGRLDPGQAVDAPPPAAFESPPEAAQEWPSTEAPGQAAPEQAAPGQAAPGQAAPEPTPAQRAEPERSAAETPLKEASQEMIRVAAGLLDDLVSLAGESSIMRGRIQQQVTDFGLALEEMAATIDRIRQQVRRLELETEAQVLFRQEQTARDGYEDFDPLEMDRYSQLQELARTLAESASDVTDLRQTLVDRARDTETLLLQQGRIHTELQEGLMRTRMVPFSRLLPRLQRIVRQVGRELSKPVNLEVRDAEGELDRNILERMIPPLEHMLRNAVDHGIESPERRAERGKPAAGTIMLRLAREGGEILVEVSDDGGGIDADVVRSKAIEKGLLDPDAEASEEELLGFIMAPGFSTASAVTQISGRGVGMDVVNSEVRQMGGSISIASVLGEGTRFTVRLPFTVSINRALMVVVGDEEYALPLNTIEGIVRVSPQQLKLQYEGDAPGFDYAGRHYALSYLGAWLGHSAPVREDVQSLPVLMVRSGDQGRAVHVDGVAGSREIVVKNLGPQFATVQGVSGATILGDGRVVVILDLPSLLRGAAEFSLDQGSVPLPRREDRPRQVLVVDDSVTVRKVTTRLLERQGMAVTVAKDGVEAVSVLQDMRPDVMLLDIEMPRMDGFEVARHVRNEARLAGLPIIMITSRTGDKHREKAEELGVNRFLGKPFQEAELLATIEELTAT